MHGPIEIEEAHLKWFPLRVEATNISFTVGRKETTALRWRAGSIKAPFSFIALLRGSFVLGEVEAIRLRVEVLEGDLKSAPEEEKSIPRIEIQSIVIKEGVFIYRRLYQGRDALISIDNIEARIGRIASEEADFVTETDPKARLEKSGAVELGIRAKVFSSQPDLEVKLSVKNQKLSELDAYFFPADGVRLKGTLFEGQSRVEVRGRELICSAQVIYQGLDVMFSSTGSRSEVTAFLSNLLRGVKIDDRSLGEKPKDQIRRVTLRRNPGESLVSFILRGMKIAALGVATS